jgi:hypothetical protein
MSNYDGTGEKRRDGGDSGAFRGRRHPFLDRRVDWEAIDKARHGTESADATLSDNVSDKLGMPREVSPFQITNDPDPRDQRVRACVAAVKQLSTSMDKWYLIRSSMISEYQSAGPDPVMSEKALMSFIGSVNQRLGRAGEINAEKVTGERAEQIAAADSVEFAELCLNVRVFHSGGTMGPIGVAFTNHRS